jgi:hypothetical protein
VIRRRATLKWWEATTKPTSNCWRSHNENRNLSLISHTNNNCSHPANMTALSTALQSDTSVARSAVHLGRAWPRSLRPAQWRRRRDSPLGLVCIQESIHINGAENLYHRAEAEQFSVASGRRRRPTRVDRLFGRTFVRVWFQK